MESVVQIQMRILFFPLALLYFVAGVATPSMAKPAIENNRDKEYHLREEHGPWMIMVATFRDIHEQERKKEGFSAEQAANELVYELREKGIPAYVHSQEAKVALIDTIDRLGNADKRKYAAQRDMICVLAGNYEKIDDPLAQKTLAYVKRFHPKFMTDPKSGAVVRNAGGAKGPLGGAFLSINPERNPNEIARRRPDNETKYLNSGIDFALVNVKRKYTLKIATYSGKSAVPLGSSKFSGNESGFEKSLFQSSNYNLTQAGEDATQLTYALRHNSNENRFLGADKFEAYVYHDKFQSVVTVGSFDSKNDPQINRLVEIFQAKHGTDKTGSFALTCVTLSLPGKQKFPGEKVKPVQTWAFDPVPELIEIPRIK